MNHNRRIILLASFLVILGCLYSTKSSPADGAPSDSSGSSRQASTAPISTPDTSKPASTPAANTIQTKAASGQAASSAPKAIKAAPGKGITDTSSGDEALKLLEKLPNYGLGILTAVRNLTKYPISIESSDTKMLNDQLPEGTIVRIKSLEPKFGAEGKYYSLKKVDAKDPNSQGGFSFMPDTSDPADKSTNFIITRRVSQDLKDWIGIMHPISEEKTLQVNPATLDVGFFNKNFRDEKDTPSHWSIIGTTLDKCSLRNRKTGGFLSFFSGEKEIRTTKTEPLKDMFGIEQAPFEIISATFSEEKGNRYDVTDVIKIMALKDGRITIPGDMYDFFSKPKPAGIDTVSNLTIHVRNGKKIEDITVKNGGKDNPTAFDLSIPSVAQLGTMLESVNKTWRGPVLEYNTIVTISSDFYPYLLWTRGARYWGRMDEIDVGGPSDLYSFTGPQFFMLKAKDNLTKTGPINYGDEIEIWSLCASTDNHNNQSNKSPVEILNPAKKWWLNFGSRHGSDHNEILIAPLDDKDERTKNSTFSLSSVNKLTGPVYQNDIVKIMSKAHIKDGKEVTDKSYLGLNIWVYADSRDSWSELRRGELLLRDVWGTTNRWRDNFSGQDVGSYNRMDVQGGFKIQTASTNSLSSVADNIYTLQGIQSISGQKQTNPTPDITNKLSDLVEKLYTAQGIKDVKRTPGKLIQLSVKSSKEVWAVNAEQEAWKWNGTSWTKIPSPNPLKQICVGLAGEVWGVSTDNKVWQYIKPNWTPLGGDDMKQIALRSSKEVWGIGTDDFAYLFNGSQWDKNSPDEGGIISISVSANGTTWAIDNKQRPWRLGKDKSWVAVNAPSDKAALIQLAVRNDNDVWAISNDGSIYSWDGKAWTKQDGRLSYIALASGSKTVVTKTDKKMVNATTTTDANNKPVTDPSAAIKLEIVQLGIGGNLPPGKTVEVNIPVRKSPHVSGFAATRIDSFQPGSKLIVIPLLNRGGAWPENSLTVPGRTTVSFMANCQDSGDIQVLFGPEISDNYRWKVVIGGWNNTKSAIVKHTISGGQSKETVMYEITKKQNPLAAASPGNFTPYWVSYDKGFIMAGMGLPGENVFMAQRVKETPGDADITRVGFGSNKSNVEYTEIQFLPPVVIEKAERVYARSAEAITLGANQTSFTWSKFPFRADDRGAIGFEIQGTDNVVLALGQQTSNDAPHYAIVFGSDKASIIIKKWDSEKKKYIDRAILPKSKTSGINLDPTKSIPVWVSYQDGLIAIGNGDVGQNPQLVYQDLNNYDGIHTVGFGNFGPNPATVKNLQATPPVLMHIELKEEAYRTGQVWYQFRGGVTIIMPFEYEFIQKDASVIATDMLSNEVFYSGATPGGGNLFKFLLKIGENGFPELIWETEPENLTQQKVKQAIVQTAAAAELQKAKADLETKEGKRIRDLATADSKQETARATGIQNIANTMTSAASAVGMAGGMSLWTSIPALLMSAGLSVGGVVASGIASKHIEEASRIDYEGAKSESALRKKSQDLEAVGNQMQYQSNVLTGQAQFAFTSPTSYTFVDSPERQALGAAGIPADVLENAQKANDLITQAGLVKPTTIKNFELLVSFLQDVVFLMSHSYVINDFLKQKLLLYISDLFAAYNVLFPAKPDIRITNDFINLMMTAMNNSYLLSSTKDANQKEAIYVWINKLAHNLLQTQPSISLKPSYGEYIWLPIPMPQADQAILELTVEGRHDVFVCFAKEPEKVRNTTKEIYEIVLAGWDNTKHAFRTQSLGNSVKEFTKDDYPDTMMNPYLAQTYTITLNNGTITVSVQGKTMTWTDPYPIKGIKWIGISNWDSEVNFKKIALKSIKAPATSTSGLAPANAMPTDVPTGSMPADTPTP